MGFAFIREGDASSHGGRVLACDPTNTDDGKPIALIGDMVSCPRRGGIFPIVRVKTELRMSFNGRAVASEGDMTACGATLIASQSNATASPATSRASGSIGGGVSVLLRSSASTSNEAGPHRGRFLVVDDDTGEPIANYLYIVSSSDGQIITGATDANGYTDWLDSNKEVSLKFQHASPA
ncbi:PAAR domain-containing protein [Burkholderia gladioli]|uniref:PAAR domain-containing protein n=1 Tax=Burkholderia gladioli TaxID=28095 RepID=UPI00163E2514|nr:PAAR domain-containing protein [Burkholderia gladioli]